MKSGFSTCGVALLFTAIAVAGCGYHVGGRGSALPATLHTIAVPAFVNKTPSYRMEQRLTGAVIHELLARTSYHVVSDPVAADAVLHGEVSSIESVVAVYDTQSGRATAMLITVHLKAWLEDRDDKKELYRNNDFVFRQAYEISTDVKSFFDEQNPALDRLSGDFARALVSAILEKF
jgi:outer membrane lipopolysaccharide assembly protein LptE/RlpB